MCLRAVLCMVYAADTPRAVCLRMHAVGSCLLLVVLVGHLLMSFVSALASLADCITAD